MWVLVWEDDAMQFREYYEFLSIALMRKMVLESKGKKVSTPELLRNN